MRRSTRILSRYNDYVDTNLIIYALNVDFETNIPSTYPEAISCADFDKWKRVMDEEIDSLVKNNTSKLVDKPENKKLVAYKFIYMKKDNIPESDVSIFKAGLVAKGFSQKLGLT